MTPDPFRVFVENLLAEWGIPRDYTAEAYNRALMLLLRTDMDRFQFRRAKFILDEWMGK